MQPTVQEARPPYVQFETRPIENREATRVNGTPTFKDVIYAVITPQGTKDKLEKVAVEWLRQCEQQVREGRLPQTWAAAYQHAFAMFKQGLEVPLDGHPLKYWPAISSAQLQTLLGLNIRTVEDLASVNDAVLMKLGMGARALRDLAINWLREAKEVGVSAMEITDLRQKNAALLETVEQLKQQVAALMTVSQQQSQAAVAATATATAEASDDEVLDAVLSTIK
jgi:hypothetical protein